MLELSIHALLAESDQSVTVANGGTLNFLSTLSLRRATGLIKAQPNPYALSIHALLAESDIGVTTSQQMIELSIHALLAESDAACIIYTPLSVSFYPRSPCGERRAEGNPPGDCAGLSIHALLAESDLNMSNVRQLGGDFLSTLSLRRATQRIEPVTHGRGLSIHALLAESDTLKLSKFEIVIMLSIHALLAESDLQLTELPRA